MRAGGQRSGGVFLRLVGDDDDALDAFGRDLPRDLRDGQAAVERLAAGHRDGVVVEDLVGDIDAGRDREARIASAAGMDVGAVAEILEDVAALGERRLADPVRAFAAHLGEALGLAVHPLRHEVAADAGIGARALRHHGRGVVRTARAEIGHARRRRRLRVARAWRSEASSSAMLGRDLGARPMRSSDPLRKRHARSASGSSAPLAGNSHSPFSSSLPMTGGAPARAIQFSLIWTSMSARFSSTTMIRSRPSAKAIAPSGSIGQGSATL